MTCCNSVITIFSKVNFSRSFVPDYLDQLFKIIRISLWVFSILHEFSRKRRFVKFMNTPLLSFPPLLSRLWCTYDAQLNMKIDRIHFSRVDVSFGTISWRLNHIVEKYRVATTQLDRVTLFIGEFEVDFMRSLIRSLTTATLSFQKSWQPAVFVNKKSASNSSKNINSHVSRRVSPNTSNKTLQFDEISSHIN